MLVGAGIAIVGIIAGAFFIAPQQVPQVEGAFSNQAGGGGAYPREAMVQATTTPCAIAIPNSTSSITHFALTVNAATGTNETFVIGTSTTPYATSSTPFQTVTVSANNTPTFSYEGTSNADIASPRTYITVGTAAGDTIPVNIGGVCSAIIVGD